MASVTDLSSDVPQIERVSTDDFLRMNSLFSLASTMAIEEEDEKAAKRGFTGFTGLFRDILQTENDMAGINGLWLIGFIILVIFRLNGFDDVKDAKWGFIVCIPVVICCFTWIFSYVITKYRKATIVESLKAPPFVIPFLLKITVAMVVFGRLFYAQGGIRDRYHTDDEYSGYCTCTIGVVYFVLFLSTVITEIMITTVMVNSSQNLLPKIPRKIDAFLFVTRPSIWVYNRLIVMFVTFYCFYFLFGVGPFCASQCRVDDVKGISGIGTAIFTLPFKDVLYLFKWYSFDLSSHATAKDVQFAVIQQFLIWTTILDFAMDIWSISLVRRVGSSILAASRTRLTSQSDAAGRLSTNSTVRNNMRISHSLQEQSQQTQPNEANSNGFAALKSASPIPEPDDEDGGHHMHAGRETQNVATEVAAILREQIELQPPQESAETESAELGTESDEDPNNKPQIDSRLQNNSNSNPL